jgi:putative ABC transport system permease protein
MTRSGQSLPRVARALLRWCLAAYPRSFRRANGEALLETLEDQIAAARAGAGPIGPLLSFAAECGNAVLHGLALRFALGGRRPGGAAGAAGGRQSITHRRSFMRSVVQDVRFAIRDLRKQPGFMLTAVLLLGLGIGSNTAVFSVLNAYLLRPLPLPESERLVDISSAPPNATPAQRAAVPPGVWDVEWPAQDEVIEYTATWDLDGFTLAGGNGPEAVDGAWVSPGYFSITRPTPTLGRVFGQADGEPTAAPVAVISHRLWQRRYGGDPDIVGRTVTAFSVDRPMDAEVYTIVGVLPPDFWFVNPYHDFLANLHAPRRPYMVKLQPGITRQQAAQHFTALVKGQLPGVDPDWSMYVQGTHEAHVQRVRPVITVLAITVGLVLLIACGNAAILLMVRAVRRERELTLRRALGANRLRIARQLMTEGLVMAGMAGILGVLLAWLALGSLAPVVQQQLGVAAPGGVDRIAVDALAISVALGVSTLTGVLFALVPAFTAGRGGLTTALNEGSRTGSDTHRRQLARHILIGGEVAISLTLLIGAALMVRSALNLSRVDLGFEPENVISANAVLRMRSYPEDQQRIEFVDRFLERVRSLPGVSSAGLIAGWPFSPAMRSGPVATEPTRLDPASQPMAGRFTVDGGYFGALRIPLLRGRTFNAGDRPGTTPVVILGESLADKLWPGGDPVGRHVHLDDAPDAPWHTVVGVVGDVRENLDEEAQPNQFYVPYSQDTRRFFWVMARTAAAPSAVISGMQQALREIDPTHALAEIALMSDLVASRWARPRFLATSLTAFGAFAVALALFGLYSIISYAVTQRRRDIAIRMAMGAAPDEVVGWFVQRGSMVVTAGVVLGLLGSRLLSGVLESQLFGVTSLDLSTYAGAAVLLGAVAVAAVWLPARRAAGTDPMQVLRQE